MAGRGGIDSVLRYAVSGVAGGIGLASESIHARKERKRAKANATASSSRASVSPQENRSSVPTSPQEEDADEEIIIEQVDEKQWDLDDAQQGLPGGAYSDEELPEYTVDERSAPKKSKPDGVNITEAFLNRYPPPPPTDNAQPLPLPVILPQRRPKDRTRGFIRAYAPELEKRGIDQAMFLDFLHTFEKASEASPWINAVNLAGIATSFIPDGFGVGLAVGIAIQMSVRVAMDLQSRSRTNAFLDKMNDGFYRPRGLYCLVMTWSPESSEVSSTFDLTSKSSSKSQSQHNGSGPFEFAKKFSNSSGITYADMEFPEVAPLIYPALDNLAAQESEEAVRTRDKLKQKAKFVDDYWDKRAQAKHIGKHPDSVLAQTPKPTFTSRYADPNHPASSGSLISLVTGGHINPPAMQGGGLGGLLGRGGLGSAEQHGGSQAYGGRGGGLGSLLNRAGGPGGYDRGGWGMSGRTGSRKRMQMQQGASFDDQGYTQGQTRADAYAGRGMNTQGGFGGGRGGGMGVGGGLGLGSGPLGLPIPTPQMAIKKLLKKDVLYLMIVNMPSEAEMAAAVTAIEGQRR